MKTKTAMQGEKCQSTRLSAEFMGNLQHTSISENGKTDNARSMSKPAANAAKKLSLGIGSESRRKQSKHTGGSAPAVAKKNTPSSPSTTPMEAARSSASKDCADGDSISGLGSADIHRTDTKSFALTATARKDKAESARTKNSFTPGPWQIVDQREMPEGHLLVVSPYDGSIADITKTGGEASCLDAEANARLIAAAPELLAALSEVKAWYLSQANAKMPKALCYALDDAILRAEGK